MPRFVAHGNLRFGFLRLSTIKKWPDTLKSDHRGLRNSKEKFMWVVVGGGGWWVVVGGPMIIVTRISLKLPISIGYCLESMKSDLVNIQTHAGFGVILTGTS